LLLVYIFSYYFLIYLFCIFRSWFLHRSFYIFCHFFVFFKCENLNFETQDGCQLYKPLKAIQSFTSFNIFSKVPITIICLIIQVLSDFRRRFYTNWLLGVVASFRKLNR